MAAYIDGIKEARRVLVDDMLSSLVTVARDVKFQTEFNPDRVAEYRLEQARNRNGSPVTDTAPNS